MMSKRHLIIVPGVGDNHPIYHVGAFLFRIRGFTPHIVPFGWNSTDPATYEPKYHRLASQITGLNGDIYILGVSAGGTVAASCLRAYPGKITKVATLSSPLKPYSTPGNPLIELAIAHTEADIAAMPADVRSRLLSVHAIQDQVVPVALSQLPGVRTKTIPAIHHIPSIVLGLTLLGLPIVRFFREQR